MYICPNCKNRSVDIDGFEGFSGSDALQCRRCGFGFIFQLLEDYYPAPSTGFIVCDRDARVLAAGRGVFELTGFQEGDLMGRDVSEALTLSDPEPIAVVQEWGVRQLGLALELSTRAAIRKAVTVDLFPAYDEDGGLLVALTPRTTPPRETGAERSASAVSRPADALRGSIQSCRETASGDAIGAVERRRGVALASVAHRAASRRRHSAHPRAGSRSIRAVIRASTGSPRAALR